MPPSFWELLDERRGRDQEGHVDVEFRIRDGRVVPEISFVRLAHAWGHYVHESLDEYDFSCLARLFDTIAAGTAITIFVPRFRATHTLTKLQLQDADGVSMWRASWHDDLEACEQRSVGDEIADHLFIDERSLWFTGDALLTAKEFLALSPRPTVQSVSLLDGYYVPDPESAAEESEDGESEGSEELGSESGGTSDGASSDVASGDGASSGASSASDFNFPKVEVTAELRKGKRVEGTFHGRAGDVLGVWTPYLRFIPAEGCSDATGHLWRGHVVDTPSAKGAVLVRILGGIKVGGSRAHTSQQACYVCLLFSPDQSKWHYATMPTVTREGEEVDAEVMASIEDQLCTFEPVGVAAAISQASRAASSSKEASSSKAASSSSVATVPTPGLPPDWKSARDPADGQTYYYNKKIGISQFERPVTLPPGWKYARDPADGRTYYYNRELRASQYEMPVIAPSGAKRKRK